MSRNEENSGLTEMLLSFNLSLYSCKSIEWFMRYKINSESMSLQQFCCWYQKKAKSGILVLGTASLCLNYCLHPPWHTLNQFLTHLWVNLVPHLLHPLPQVQYPSWRGFLPTKPLFKLLPEVFNWIEVWRLCWP